MSTCKPSKYNFIFKEGKGFVIYNTLSKTLAYVNTPLAIALKRGELALIPLEQIAELEKNGLIVEERVDELDVLKSVYWNSKFNSEGLGLTILPTYECNMACTYCYEGANKPPLTMGMEIVERIYEWLIALLERSRYRTIELSFYGGEPLLCPETVYSISQKVKKWCVQHSIDFGTHLITNGTLLTPEITKEMLKLNLRSVQVTIDGPPDIHNKRRPLKSGRESFPIIYNNIKNFIELAPDNVLLSIRINVDRENTAYVPALLKIFEKDGISSRIGVNIGRIFLTQGNIEYMKNVLPDEILDKVLMNFLKRCRQAGFTHSLISAGAAFTFCGGASAHAWVIDPQGNLYKCLELLNKEEFCMGNIEKGVCLYKHLQWLSIDPFEDQKCRNCVFLPCCGGGCIARSFFKYGDILKRVCPWSKEWFETVLRHRVKMLYSDKILL